MTTTKTEHKAASTATKKEIEQADLRIAYEIHTLVQLVYAEIATSEPWLTSNAPPACLQDPAAWMPPLNTGAAPTWPGPIAWPW